VIVLGCPVCGVLRLWPLIKLVCHG
jgi:hypothetical protein